ncbi:MAG: hypothetical protein A3B70_00565 [Deltaproteobacteria bacterium RIFCSPHIGHO2_02_FULL_40_11]|nr:MAG: hypothetical protein A3B70_00565 [Deltaproteobacteria bacterium RIFCSPHIGHO2_02_FULL_40_11]
MDVVELSKKLIQIPSLSGHEMPMFQSLKALFQKQGYYVKAIPTSKNRLNLFATKGSPKVLFCSHIDTVPPYVPLKETKTHLYGRGACDTKGVIAAQLVAGLGSAGVGFLYVVGEEVDHCGAIDASKKIPKVDAMIIGEPTQNKLAQGTKGIVKVTLQAFGKAAHSAYPNLGHSAIHALLTALSKIQKLNFGHHPKLGAASLNIGVISGGVAANVFAPEASAQILVRTVYKSKKALSQIQKACGKKVKVKLQAMNDPITLSTLPGFQTDIVSFNTDIPYLMHRAKNCYLLGPGSILEAHHPKERISKGELYKGVALYRNLLQFIFTKS